METVSFDILHSLNQYGLSQQASDWIEVVGVDVQPIGLLSVQK